MDGGNGITRGAIETIFKTGSASSKPIVQVIDLKRISSGSANPSAPPRYRLAISDGAHFQQAMIATQLNALIAENRLQVNSLVRLHEIICNTVQDKRIVIILNVEVITLLPMKIGNPVSIDVVMSSGGQPPQVQPQIPPPQSAAVYQTNANGPQVNNTPQIKPQFHNPGAQGNQAFNHGGYGGAHLQMPRPASGQTGAIGQENVWNAPATAPNPFANRFGGSSAITKMASAPSSMYRPINSINPYQNGWTIRGRCTFKSELRKFQNARGEGQVVSFELSDESGSIRITGFTQNAQRIQDTVQMNHIYKVSRGFLKQANERFNRSTSSFEMTIDNNSLLEEVDDDGSFMQVKYNFTKISDLESVEVKGNCDVVGIVTGVGPMSEITIRSTNEPCSRRSVTITDDSNASVDLTLWRKQAESFLTEDDLDRHPVLLVRNAVRGDFGGVSLNMSRMSTLELDPVNVPEANKLRAWFDAGGLKSANVLAVTSSGSVGGKVSGPRKSLVEARLEEVEPTFSQANNADGNGTAIFVTRGMVTFVNTKSELYYPSDPVTKKKVNMMSSGMWESESSGKQFTNDEIQWRYKLSMKVADHSASHWVSAFDEVGSVLFGRSALELRGIEEEDRTHYEHIVEDALCRPMIFKIQVKEQMWKDARQIRYVISRVEPINFADEGGMLLKEIQGYGGI